MRTTLSNWLVTAAVLAALLLTWGPAPDVRQMATWQGAPLVLAHR